MSELKAASPKRDEISVWLRSYDWSHTPLGAAETWSDGLKTAVQIRLTELNQIHQSKQTPPKLDSDQTQEPRSIAAHQAAQADAFRVRLTNGLRPLTDANQIQAIAARILGESLRASRVIYIEVLPSHREVIVHKNYTNGVTELSGQYNLEDFGRNLTTDHRAGRTAIVPNVDNHPQYTADEIARYQVLQIAAHIDVPLIKNQQFVALLAVHQSTPRQWTEDEVKRVEETAEQTWAAVERARAEAALHDSRSELERQLRKFDTIVAAIPDFIYTFDRAGRFTYINPALLNLWQKTLDQALGKNFFELEYPTDLAARLQQQIQQVIATGQPLKDETPYTSAVGTRAYEYVFVPLFSAVGAVEAVAGVTRDITERKQAEQALRQSEERTRNILESITEAFFALDEHWQFTYLNPSAETVLDRTLGDLVGKTIWEEFPGLAGNELAQAYRSAMDNREAGSMTAFYPDHDRWYEVRTYPAANGITVYFRNVTEQIQTAATLRQSEERYRTLFESIDEGFCIVEVLLDHQGTPRDYRILETNPTFEQQTGLQQAIDKTARQLNLEDHWIQIYGQVALTGEPVRFENGSATLNRWFDVYACPMGEPEARKVAIVFKDISDRKRAEELLQRAAEMDAFRVSLSDLLWPLADSGEIQATASRLLGQHLGVNRVAYFEVQGNDYVVEQDYVHEAPALTGRYAIESLGSKLLAAYPTGRPVSVADVEADPHLSPEQKSAYTANQIEAYIGIPLIKQGQFIAGLAVHSARSRDWTPDEVALAEEVAERTWIAVERARSEALIAADLHDTQRLRELSTRLVTESDIQTLYQEILSAAIALTQADAGTVQILDPATQDLVLLATQNFDRSMTEHFYRVNAGSQTSCGIALKTGDRSFIDFDQPEGPDSDGSLRRHVAAGYLSGQSTPLITRSGKPIGMVSTHWCQHHRPSDRQLRFLDLLTRQAADLIEQRQTAAEREQLLSREQAAREEAERANRIKDEFLAVLSHELRSPLNPILGWTRLLQKGQLDQPRQAIALETIERNAKLQSQLIEDLLDISRIMQGKLSLIAAPCELAFVIAAAVETVQLSAEAKQIDLLLDLDSGVAPINGDAARLQQVVWNLLTNAVKFTPNGGQVRVQLRQLGSLAQIQISDTGKGIHSSFLPHVFEYFRQEDGSTTRRFGGLGLGLAIVRQIVEMHGGTVQVESLGEGQGATFTVQLPAGLQTPPIASEPPSLPVVADLPLADLQILVVDDDPDARELQVFLLERSGATITAVASGLEALQALEQLTPDLIVSDVGMAEMDGYGLIQQLRARPRDQGGLIPAIALTAYAGEFNQQKALQAGFQMHLTKPVDPDRLIAAIVALLATA